MEPKPMPSWHHSSMQDFYLKHRESLCFYSNVFYLFKKPQTTDFLTQAVCLTHQALLFYNLVQKKALAKEFEKEKELNQDFYPYFFSTCRIPQIQKDTFIRYENQNHIVVVCRGNFYVIENPFNCNLKSAFLEIIQNSKPSVSPGLLTTLPRKQWCSLRQTINLKTLARIESAILLVALEPDMFPKNRTQALWELAFGNPYNRYFDKSHQLIIFGNGLTGLNRDHTLLDGHPTLTYLEYLNKNACMDIKNQNYSIQKLEFDLDPENLNSALEDFNKQKSLFYMEVFDDFQMGKNQAKQLGLRSDFLVQAAIHLTLYRLENRFFQVTESVHMRHNPKGRYATVFTLTPELKTFLKNLDRQSLLQAQEAHKKLIKRCKGGELENPNPLDYDVTTTHPGEREGLETPGYTDTDPNKIGISYIVKENHTTFFIKGDGDMVELAQKMRHMLSKSLKDLITIGESKN